MPTSLNTVKIKYGEGKLLKKRKSVLEAAEDMPENPEPLPEDDGEAADAVEDIAKATEANILGKVFGVAKDVNDFRNMGQSIIDPNTSLSRRAKQTTFQFPLLVSSDIGMTSLEPITQAFQDVYSTMLITVLSFHTSVDIKKYGSLQDFLKTIHNNNNFDTNFNKVAHIVGGLESYKTTYEDFGTIVEESLNSAYLPYNRTKAEIRRRLEMAYEASSQSEKLTERYGSKVGPQVSELKNRARNLAGADPTRVNDAEFPEGDLNAILTGRDKLGKNNPDPTSITPFKRKDMEAVTNMEPNLLDVTFLIHGGGQVYPQKTTIGVKAYTQLLPRVTMIANLVEATTGSHTIFKFVKRNAGEMTTLDMLFGVSEARQSANDRHGDTKWFAALRRRKEDAKLSRVVGGNIHPTTTIIVSDADIEEVKQRTGVDLTKARNVQKIMKRYYFLGFAIVNSEENNPTVRYMFDGDDDWAYTTLSSLTSEKEKNLQQKELEMQMKDRELWGELKKMQRVGG